MKRFFYALFALFFNLSRAVFPLKEHRAAFLSMHNEALHDSLGEVLRAMEQRGFDTVLLTRRDLESVGGALRFFFVRAPQLATAKYVFLNDNFMPMGKLHFRSAAVVTQLWHAEGVFKKFGLSIPQPDDVRRRELAGNRKLSFVVCSSKAVAPFYAEAFGVPQEKVLPLGAPRIDRLLAPESAAQAKKKLLTAYPELSGKRLVLYAPTFRDTDAENAALLQRIDMKKFAVRCGSNAALLVRLHPQIHPAQRHIPGATDVTDFDDVCALALACDALVTDYSSICMPFALLKKQCVFFAFDLPQYKAARDFYFDYAAYVPGAVTATFDETLDALAAPTDKKKLERFLRFNFDELDCNNTLRVLDAVLDKEDAPC